jgi:molecular chaperone DnaJ
MRARRTSRRPIARRRRSFTPIATPGIASALRRISSEVLSDSQKRAQYDRYGHAGPDQGFTFGDTDFRRAREAYREFGFGGFDNLFDLFFRQGAPQSAPERARGLAGESIEYRLRITLEDAARGTKMTLSVPRLVACPACSGSGMEPGSKKRTCSTCKGHGQIEHRQQSFLGSFVSVRTCPECEGQGEIVEQPCHRCHGNARVKDKSKISISVPAGVDTGSRLRLRDQGNAGVGGGPHGDLFIVIEVIPHPQFQRDGQNVLSKIAASYSQATLGTKLKVQTLWGEETLSVPAGTQPGTEFRLRGKGMPSIHGLNGKGDHIVQVTVDVPTKLSAKQRQAVEELAKVFDVSR